MKDEYDFTNTEQGKFYRPIEELDIPMYKVINSIVLISNVHIGNIYLSFKYAIYNISKLKIWSK